MVESGRRFSRKVSSKSPLMYSYYETQYLGTAHGLTGILQQLLSVPGYFQVGTFEIFSLLRNIFSTILWPRET